jgi:putative transposase
LAGDCHSFEKSEHDRNTKNDSVTNPSGNTRNGWSRKTLKGEFGELPIEIPRDRDGSFEPQIIAKQQTRWHGFDDKILSLYARGMTVREIQGHLGIHCFKHGEVAWALFRLLNQ